MVNKKDNSVSVAIGQKIKETRKSFGMTGKQLGLRLGVTQQQISRYESGTTPMTIDILFLIVRALDVKIEEILSDYISSLDYEHYFMKQYYHKYS